MMEMERYKSCIELPNQYPIAGCYKKINTPTGKIESKCNQNWNNDKLYNHNINTAFKLLSLTMNDVLKLKFKVEVGFENRK